MSDQTPGDSRPPLNLPLSIVLVVLALVGNGLLLFWPRPVVAPVVADAGKPATPTTTPTTPAQPPVQPTPANPTQPPASPFAQTPTTPTPTQPTQPTPPKPEEPAKDVIERGLTLVVQSQAGGDADRRTARVLSLYVPKGSAPTPFVAAGPFTATFEGFINKEVWDKVAFTVEGTGSLTFTVGETEVLKLDGPDLASGKPGKIKLNKGANPIKLVYKSPADGDARLRVFWAGSEIPTEPLPATLFTHNVGTKEFKAAAKLRSGRELVGTMRCTKCHAADAATAEGMPELAIDAPDLREVGARLNQGWMAAWIRDPKALRVHATMPKLIVADGKTDADMDGEAASMAAYLATLGKGDDGAVGDDAAAGRGGHLFAKLACVSCHMANGDTPAHIPLTHVKAKFKPKALVAFLREPTKHYAWIKMPTFGFTEAEATDLAAWLLKNGAEEPKKISGGDAGLGKVLMAGAGCASCHQLGDVPPVIGSKLKDLAQNRANGCLATDVASRKRAPDFGFTGDEISALRGFVKTDQKSLAVRDHVEFAERRIDAQRCSSCHQRDGAQSVFSSMSGMVEKLVASLPPAPAAVQHGEHGEGGAASGNPPPMLTFTGDKLRPEWTAKFLRGELPYRPRPWLDLRMPAFKAGADVIAQGLAMSHGLPPVTPADPASSGPGTPADGIKLLGADGGFNCNQCHSLGSAPAVAIFEAPGINLGYVGQRLQKDYFHRWMLNPLRFDATTRMPKFAQDDGTTPLTDVLGGQSRDQFEAIWQQLIEVGKGTDFPH